MCEKEGKNGAEGPAGCAGKHGGKHQTAGGRGSGGGGARALHRDPRGRARGGRRRGMTAWPASPGAPRPGRARRAQPCGGSASGWGAGVAAGFFAGAVGSDTGGSIRLPAGCSGVVGLKPTYGRVSRAGAMVLSWSMDHLGPLAWTARDVALMLNVMAGSDPADATTSRRAVPDYTAGLDVGIKGVRIGLPENYFFEGVDEEIAAGVRRAARKLEGLDARVAAIRLPDPTSMMDVSMLITRAEASTVHARVFRERPPDLQPIATL